MYQLILDSAHQMMYLALVKADKVVQELYIEEKKTDNLVFYLEKLMKQYQVSFSDVKTIVVGDGPGSYTGIRAACMVAKMLAYTKNIELKRISSLYLMASGVEAKNCAVMIDARRNCCFAGVYANGEAIINDQYIEIPAFYELLANLEDVEVIRGYRVNPLNVLKHAEVVDVKRFVPNYLREVEAVRNLR